MIVKNSSDYQTFRLDLEDQTLLFASYQNRLPEMIYWGESLPPNEDLLTLVTYSKLPIAPSELEEVSRASILPELGWGFTGFPGFHLANQDNDQILTQFQLKDHQITSKKDQNTLLFHSTLKEDHPHSLLLTTELKWNKVSKMLLAQNTITNLSQEKIHLNWLSAPVFSFSEEINRCWVWGEKWVKEFQRHEISITRDIFLRENRRGRTSHEIFPAIVLPFPGTNQTTGKAYGFHLAWSGNHRMLVEVLSHGQRQLQFGSLEESGEVVLENQASFSTPKLYSCFSNRGINGIRSIFHNEIRTSLLSFGVKKSPRKVHCNSWEASYFDHDLEKLKHLARLAHDSGAERFILDDGWFRSDDTSSLGDWQVDRNKYPDDLHPLIDYLHSLGMEFGLWIEPEMISPNSNLYRNHPEWAIAPSHLKTIQGRNQLLLNLTRPEVFDYLFTTISNLVECYQPNYLKWDHNRILSSALDSTKPIARKQTESLYHLWRKIKEKHPHIEIESCASGGGRIDLEILKWSDRFWFSDSNDPVERWKIQYEASTFFPPEIIGSHIGPRKCHTSGRITELDFRAKVALTGHLGYEFDLTELTSREKKLLKKWTYYYLEKRFFLHTSNCLVTESPADHLTTVIFLAPDRSSFILFIGFMDSENHSGSHLIKLIGLKEEIKYNLKKIEQEDLFKKPDIFSRQGFTLTGKTLMEHGFRVPFSNPQTIRIIEGQEYK